MFHSQASAFNIYDATPFKRDPLEELAAACKKEGIKLGFYYSQAQDWNHPGGARGSRRPLGHTDAGRQTWTSSLTTWTCRRSRSCCPTTASVAGILGWTRRCGMNTGARGKNSAAAEAAAGHHQSTTGSMPKSSPATFETPEQQDSADRHSRQGLGNVHDDEPHLGLQRRTTTTGKAPRRSSATWWTSPARAAITCSTSARPAHGVIPAPSVERLKAKSAHG